MEQEAWTLEIKPQTSWWNLRLNEIWRYRDLLMLFVRRDIVAVYKQTILGPLWFFIQPLLTTIVFTVIFGRVAKLPSDGLPHALFYMAGVVGWAYFADCLTKTSNTFTANANIFGKVYFPRMVVPFSIVITNILKFVIQLILFAGFWFYFKFKGTDIHITQTILLFPLLIILMAGLGLGFGIIISSLTTKYRDLQFLVSFGVQLLMYGTPIVYPLSMLHGKLRIIALLNPMTSVIETLRYSFLGAGTFNYLYLVYSLVFMIILLLFGLMIFHRVEKNFMDTV